MANTFRDRLLAIKNNHKGILGFGRRDYLISQQREIDELMTIVSSEFAKTLEKNGQFKANTEKPLTSAIPISWNVDYNPEHGFFSVKLWEWQVFERDLKSGRIATEADCPHLYFKPRLCGFYSEAAAEIKYFRLNYEVHNIILPPNRCKAGCEGRTS